MKYHQDGTIPTDGSIFVFGSNEAGEHHGGAARVAVEQFGAARGYSHGRIGNSYAIPTADKVGNPRSLCMIETRVCVFLDYATNHPELNFFITRIGCGIVGYRNEQIAQMFKFAPNNCSLPDVWKPWVE